jgi:hypothetical protein
MSDVFTLITTPNRGWISPYFDVVTCNKLITNTAPTSSKVFSMISAIGTLTLPIVSTTPCDAIALDSPDIDLVTNTYTAPTDCYLQVSLSCQINTPNPSSAVDSVLRVYVNNILTNLTSRQYVSFAVAGSSRTSVFGILKLSAGDVVSIDLANFFVGVGFTYDNFNFSGVVL